jgi:hypothetical protein
MLLNFNGRSLDVNSVFEKDIKPNLMSIIEKGNKDNCFLYNSNTLWFGQRLPIGFEFNKVYYKVNDKTLQGFKIRMCILNKNGRDAHKIYYLVEYPNGSLEWKEDFLNSNTLLFESPNDFFDYLNGNSEVAVRIDIVMLSHFSNNSPLDYIRFSKTWYWSNKDEKPMIKYSNIKYILFNELGLIPILGLYSTEYHSQEECMKEKMNGFTIEEFSQTDSFNVDIEIKKKEPIIRTLKFIEQ